MLVIPINKGNNEKSWIWLVLKRYAYLWWMSLLKWTSMQKCSVACFYIWELGMLLPLRNDIEHVDMLNV